MAASGDDRAAFVRAVVSDIQVIAGTAPHATFGELVEMFTSLSDRLPEARTQVDRLVMRRLLADVTRRIYRHAGGVPTRRVIDSVADADDPRVEFKMALAALRSSSSATGRA
jgi:hypothetical protein